MYQYVFNVIGALEIPLWWWWYDDDDE